MSVVLYNYKFLSEDKNIVSFTGTIPLPNIFNVPALYSEFVKCS